MFEPRNAETEFTTTTPITYNIDYSPQHLQDPGYTERIAEAPPVLLHVGHDVPFKSMYGPADLFDPWGHRRLSPSEVQTRMERIGKYVEELHEAGSPLVIPYICSMFIFGNAERRKGFWEFYDNWEEYSDLGLGSRPREDPITWIAGEPRKLEHMDTAWEGMVYEPCINRRGWRRFLRSVVALIARVGYDGVFSDVNASSCENACCRRLFARYLAARYTAREMEDLFGFSNPRQVRVGKPGDGLLWVETVNFRGERMADLFSELRREGGRRRDTFILIPNLSPYQHVDGVWDRIGNGQVISSWTPVCPLIMFEEMNQPGLFGKGVVSNFIFQYKLAFANTTRAGCLLYGAKDYHGVSIAMAEASSGGGGAFIQPGYSCPAVRRQYRTFYEQHRGLLKGLVPYSRVGLVFSYQQLAWGSRGAHGGYIQGSRGAHGKARAL